jgi:hypothetical protein
MDFGESSNNVDEGARKTTRKRKQDEEGFDGEKRGAGGRRATKHRFEKGAAKRKYQKRMADPLQSFKF